MLECYVFYLFETPLRKLCMLDWARKGDSCYGLIGDEYESFIFAILERLLVHGIWVVYRSKISLEVTFLC